MFPDSEWLSGSPWDLQLFGLPSFLVIMAINDHFADELKSAIY